MVLMKLSIAHKMHIYVCYIYSGCADPLEIPDATFGVVHDNNVVYECDVALNLIGNKNIECQEGGNWTARSFICTGKPNFWNNALNCLVEQTKVKTLCNIAINQLQ